MSPSPFRWKGILIVGILIFKVPHHVKMETFEWLFYCIPNLHPRNIKMSKILPAYEYVARKYGVWVCVHSSPFYYFDKIVEWRNVITHSLADFIQIYFRYKKPYIGKRRQYCDINVISCKVDIAQKHGSSWDVITFRKYNRCNYRRALEELFHVR